jgi:hypothetical protein
MYMDNARNNPSTASLMIPPSRGMRNHSRDSFRARRSSGTLAREGGAGAPKFGMRVRLSMFGVPAMLLGATFAACVGSDPDPVDPDKDDTKEAGADVVTDSANSDAPPAGDADASSDAATDAGLPEKRFCSLADRDGGVDASAGKAPVLKWTATPPTSAGVPTVIATLVFGGCKLEVTTVALTPPGVQPSTGVLFIKSDAAGATCAEPKGFRFVASSYVDPQVLVAQHSFDARLFVVAHSLKGTPSGSSPVVLNVDQYDFATGDVLHSASNIVEGAPFSPPGPSRATQLTILGCDLIVRGDGSFAGAGGTNDGTFVATYNGFVAPEPQPVSAASFANY